MNNQTFQRFEIIRHYLRCNRYSWRLLLICAAILILASCGSNHNSDNNAAKITIDSDFYLVLPTNSLVLKPSVSDEKPLENLVYQWILLTPIGANIDIQNAQEKDAIVTFSEPGDYVLQISVDDGEYISVATVTVHVTSKDQSGLDQRPVNVTCLAPEQGPSLATSIQINKAFPNLPDMGAVVALLQTPGAIDNKWYAVLQQGLVLSFDNSSSASATTDFIDITAKVRSGGELGLLGMAFHPDYAINGEVFLYYTTNSNGLESHISRFKRVQQTWREDVILAVKQPYENHNGGNIQFGSDGYLYIGLGDGGSANDPFGHGQNTRTLLGSMLRIDVDGTAPYTVPADNPFSANPHCDNPELVENPQDCPEIFAWGLRNPWRWSFDSDNNRLWAGDVGQGKKEEIDIIEANHNYGWNVVEGSVCRPGGDANCNLQDYTAPIVDHDHDQGFRSIVGGYVYRGGDIDLSFLYGTYLYADTYSGDIWGISETGQGYETRLLLNTDLVIYSFARSNNGELYVLNPSSDGTGNNIYKIVAQAVSGNNTTIPRLLSDTGCVDPADPTQPAAGVIPYDLNTPLWSDGAAKQRFIALPEGKGIELTPDGDFIFPPGSVLMKNFSLNGKLIETRLLMRHADAWGGYSYRWVQDGSGKPVDAELLDNGLTETIGSQTWLFPSRKQCFVCHTQVAGIALGPETRQLNRDFTYSATGRTVNQLSTFQAVGLFTKPVPDSLKTEKMYAVEDQAAQREVRAKSYLHANCSHCHQPGGTTPVTLDFRYSTPLRSMNACNADPLAGDLGFPAIKLIDPNGTAALPNSMVPLRMESIDPSIRMPPLGTQIPDNAALDVIKAWIGELNACP